MKYYSTWRITFHPGGADEFLFLDFDDELDGHPSLPWAQQVERPAYVRGDWSGVRALGNVERSIKFTRLLAYASHEAMLQDLLDRDSVLPVILVRPLELRVLDLSVAATETTEARTAYTYVTDQAALLACTPAPHEHRMAVSYAYEIAVGRFVKLGQSLGTPGGDTLGTPGGDELGLPST